MSLKARVQGKSSYVTAVLVYGNPNVGHGQSVNLTSGGQYVSSEGHDVKSLGRTSGNVGGPFLSQKVEIESGPEPAEYSSWTWSYGQAYYFYTKLYPSMSARQAETDYYGSNTDAIVSRLGAICPSAITDGNLDADGATAISRVKPTSPVFDGATALAELLAERKLFSVPGRDGKVAGEYLNYQLGIAPAAAAVKDFRKAYVNSEKLLTQLRRNSGQRVRRQYRFPTTTEATHTVQDGAWPQSDTGLASWYVVEPGRLTTTTTVTHDKWFSGCFTYYLPQEVGMRRTVAELDYLYGIKPGVDTAWELVPFSFVADYFANVGDVLSNLNAFASDGLVMNYGYIMSKQVINVSEVWTGKVFTDGYGKTIQVASNRIYTTMQRRAANPFGFGLSGDDLSLRQLSILAALGISRK